MKTKYLRLSDKITGEDLVDELAEVISSPLLDEKRDLVDLPDRGGLRGL